LVLRAAFGRNSAFVAFERVCKKGEIMDEQYKDAGQNRPYGEQSSAGTGTGSAAGTAAAKLKEQISDKAADVRDRVADFGRKTADKIDSSREPAASALERTSSALHNKSDSVASAAHATADKLKATADYVREHNFGEMAEDVQELVKRYPGQSLAAAAILGFLVARVMRSGD
jgi:ElaB/YqjD/DUF883 family membrane-anchored ribosome-binding protein